MSGFLDSISDFAEDPLKALFGGSDNPDRNIGTTDFRNAIMKDGIQRTNRFQLELIIPDKVLNHYDAPMEGQGFSLESFAKKEEKKEDSGGFSFSSLLKKDKDKKPVQPSQLKTLSMKCLKVTMPSKSITQIKMNSPGGEYKFGHKIDHSSELSLSFLLSKDSRELRLINGWMNAIYNQRWGTVAYYDDYVAAQMKIYPLDERDDQNYVFIFEDVWPSSLSIPSFDATGSSDAADISVGISYRRFLGLNQKIDFPPIPTPTFADQLRGVSGAIGSVTQGIEKFKSL